MRLLAILRIACAGQIRHDGLPDKQTPRGCSSCGSRWWMAQAEPQRWLRCSGSDAVPNSSAIGAKPAGQVGRALEVEQGIGEGFQLIHW